MLSGDGGVLLCASATRLTRCRKLPDSESVAGQLSQPEVDSLYLYMYQHDSKKES